MGVCRVWISVHIIPAGMAVSIAMQQRENEITKVYAVSREEWRDL